MCPSCSVKKEFKKFSNGESSKRITTKYGCKNILLPPIQYSDLSCGNWFHNSCQNEYDNLKYNNKFDIIHGLKKLCINYVDKMMQIYVNSMHKSLATHRILAI